MYYHRYMTKIMLPSEIDWYVNKDPSKLRWTPMRDGNQFRFEQWYQSDSKFIYRGGYDICGRTFPPVEINLEKMQLCLQSDPSNILYLARVERGTEPPIENTD